MVETLREDYLNMYGKNLMTTVEKLIRHIRVYVHSWKGAGLWSTPDEEIFLFFAGQSGQEKSLALKVDRPKTAIVTCFE